ncbi:hypothetical protein FQR65_LT18633 [Abscondita terminalis]|nr:hypothetical protein FQR65_LT18633 [Abscondita terminalis]
MKYTVEIFKYKFFDYDLKVGIYNNKICYVGFNKENVKELLKGAQPTDTVRNILSDAGVMTEYHNVKQEAKKAAPKKEKKAKAPVKKAAPKKATTAKPKVEVEVEAKVEEAASE